MAEKTYWFSATIQQGRMDKVHAVIDRNKNICAVKNDAYQAFLMLRHELYHYLSSHDFTSNSLPEPSLFQQVYDSDCFGCLIDIDINEYAKKNKNFHRKSRWLSTLTGKRRWTYDLIGTYRKQYVYPAKICQKDNGYQLIFLDFEHKAIEELTEINVLLLGRARLYRQILFWKQNKIQMPVPSPLFKLDLQEDERITLIDVEMRQYKKYKKRIQRI